MFYPGLSGLYFVEKDGISPDLPQKHKSQQKEEFEISPTDRREIVKVGDKVIGNTKKPQLHCGDWIVGDYHEELIVKEIMFEASPEVEDNYWDSQHPKAVNLACPVPGNWLFTLIPENPDPEEQYPEWFLLGCEISVIKE